MWNKPKFSYKIVNHRGNKVLVIFDEWDENDPTMSVTNGVEFVLEDIFNVLGYMPPYIVYRDTEGNWDQLFSATDGEFTGFGGLGEIITDEFTALERVILYVE